jgi:hypothetical protein
MTRPPRILIFFPNNKPKDIIPIWTTEERAIINFISNWNKHINLKTIIPKKLMINKWNFMNLNILLKINKKRNIPYLPNFSITEAKIIDLKKEASTWALINQPCNIYMGIFTKNDDNKYKKPNLSNFNDKISNIKKLILSLEFINLKIKYNIGKEKTNV